jgi:hypothetical protein
MASLAGAGQLEYKGRNRKEPPMSMTALLERHETEGYFIVDDLVEPEMLARLREAAFRVKARARSGEVNLHNNYAAPGDPWVIDGILTTAFQEPVFAEFMTSPGLLGYARAFLGNDLRLGYLGLLTNPAHVEFKLGWHRDVMKLGERDFDETVNPRPSQFSKMRWTLALLDEANLRLVPRSHRRFETPIEQKNMAEHLSDELPGQQLIALKAGQAVFYDERIIHRAHTLHERERSSLFGTWARYVADEPKRNPIPEMRWMLRDGVRETFPESLRLHYDRWREVYTSSAPNSPLITHVPDPQPQH